MDLLPQRIESQCALVIHDALIRRAPPVIMTRGLCGDIQSRFPETFPFSPAPFRVWLVFEQIARVEVKGGAVLVNGAAQVAAPFLSLSRLDRPAKFMDVATVRRLRIEVIAVAVVAYEGPAAFVVARRRLDGAPQRMNQDVQAIRGNSRIGAGPEGFSQHVPRYGTAFVDKQYLEQGYRASPLNGVRW